MEPVTTAIALLGIFFVRGVLFKVADSTNKKVAVDPKLVKGAKDEKSST
jgi:hypothetical protein